MATDRFGNVIAAGLPYARGTILRSTEDDFTKLRHAWRIIQSRIQKNGVDSVFNFTGLERRLRIDPNDMPFLDKLRPPLTSIAIPHQQIGAEAARLLLDSIADPTRAARSVLLPLSLVVRGSTAAPAPR